MLRTLRNVLILYFVFFFSINIASEKKKEQKKDTVDITGKWKNGSPEELSPGFFTVKEYRFLDKLWQMEYVLYKDQELKTPIFKFQGEGAYEIEEASNTVEGAFNGVFTISKKYFTVLTDDKEILKDFGLDVYKELKKGVTVDISESGCAFIPPVNECDTEYDIVKISGNELFFGKRPEDNNLSTPEKRPSKLGKSLKKQ